MGNSTMKKPSFEKLISTFVFIFFSCQVFGQQSLQTQIKEVTSQSKSLQKLGKTLLDITALKKFYETRDFQPLWFQNSKLNSTALSFIEILKAPESFGFVKEEYFDKELENVLGKINSESVNESSLLWYDLFFSDLAIKFAKHLYQGRLLEPELVDDDTKFKKKTFDKYLLLNQILSGNPTDLKEQLAQMEPKNHVYLKIKSALNELLLAEKNYTWKTVTVAEEFRKVGSKSPQIKDLKNQMLFYGFKFGTSDVLENLVRAITDGATEPQQQQQLSDEYDADLEKAIAQYHLLYKTGGKGITAGLLRSMNNSLDSRKKQINIALEKARWLPEELEANHIFVNLGFQEFKLFEDNQVVMEMKTINGQKFRRTPLMRDIVTVVELNPTWTVPYSIAVKDKLAKLKENPDYLANHNMRLVDNITKEEIDPHEVDWAAVEKEDFNYTIIQGSGPDNALGLVKFPLTNPWSIYMHDTNERSLFDKPQRLISSGCMRLERPFDFANYLLKDNANYTPEKIKQIVDEALANQESITPTRIKVKKSLPVYTLFLTVDKSKDGILRFSDDFYGSDTRLKSVIQTSFKNESKVLPEFVEGQVLTEKEAVISFVGKIGEQQILKNVNLYKCKLNKKNSCELQGVIELNKAYKVTPGDYLAVHENSMSPDFIKLEPQSQKKIELISIKTPDVLLADSDLKIYKDLSHPSEQNKIFKEAFYFKTSPFNYTQYDQNDFYITTARTKSINQRYDYSMCLNAYNSLSDEAKELCDIYKNASSENDLDGLFSFVNLSSFDKLTNGQYYQMWITKPGDRVKVLNKRILLSAPYAGSESVLVFPGMYKIISEKTNQIVNIKAME
jgi:murein L,D-transpeptidase YcbB/YkuD